MQTASPAFAAHMLLADQKVAHRVLLNLPAFQADGVTAIPSSYADVTDCVVSTKSDGAITTQTPEGTLLIDGNSAVTGEIVLSGPLKQAAGVPTLDAMTVYKLFNPNDPASPLARLDRTGMTVTLQEGRWVGGTTPEFITVGTLIIDTIACSKGTVTLTLIDGRNSIRGQAKLPPVITNSPYNSGLTSEFAVDYLFRHATPGQYLSWPKQRANCVYAAGMRSSIWPEVGSVMIIDPVGNNPFVTPRFGPGKWGTAMTTGLFGNAPTGALSPPIASTSSSFFVEFWASGDTNFVEVGDLLNGGFSGTAGWMAEMFTFSATQVGINIFTLNGNNFQHFTVADTLGFHYYGFLFHCTAGSTAVTGTFYYDNTTQSISITAVDARPSGVNLVRTDYGVGGDGGTIEAFQITTESAPTPNNGFTPTLILDPSLNPLTAIPDTSGKDIWPVLQDIAAAEAAVINIDELNIAHFVNRNTIKAKTSVLTLSSRINLTALDSLEQLSTVANHIQIPVSSLQIGLPTNAWVAADVVAVPANGVYQFFAQASTIVLGIATGDSGFWIDGNTIGDTWWRACTTADGTGATVRTGIRVWVEQMSATQLRIAVVNTNSFNVYMCNPTEFTAGGAGTGDAFIVVGGQKVLSATDPLNTGSTSGAGLIADSQWPPLVTNGPTSSGGATTNVRGEILLALPQNDWRQDLGAGQALADHYLSDFYKPKPLFRNVTMISDPRLQMLDRITITDNDVSNTNTDALVVGTHIQLGNGSWTRGLDLRQCNAPGLWIVGVSKLGVDCFI